MDRTQQYVHIKQGNAGTHMATLKTQKLGCTQGYSHVIHESTSLYTHPINQQAKNMYTIHVY